MPVPFGANGLARAVNGRVGPVTGAALRVARQDERRLYRTVLRVEASLTDLGRP